jgi:hypothetical protein
MTFKEAYDRAGIKAADYYFQSALDNGYHPHDAYLLGFCLTNDQFGWFKEGAD